jgi:predicted HD superfamily hydrolase involved in NAD metabolism
MLETARSYAQDRLSQGRFRHCEETAALSYVLCGRFGLDPEAGALAGLLHDVAREAAPDRIRQTAIEDGEGLADWEREYPLVLHGRAAAVQVRRDLGLEDPEVLAALRDHVTGRPSMGPLSRVVFAADFLEPTRGFLEEGKRCGILLKDLDAMVLAVLLGTFQFLERKALPIAEPSRGLYQELTGHGRT